MVEDKVAQLLYKTAIRALDIEKEISKNIETKAQRFVIFSGILFSITSTYFFVFFDKSFDKIYLIVFIISLIVLVISIFFFTYTLKTYNYISFDMEELIIIAQDFDYNNLIKRLTGTFSDYITERRVINNHKISFLDVGYVFFLISLISIVFGIVFSIFNV